MTQETRSLHEDFLRAFYRLVYMAKIHQDNNQLLMECLDDFMQVIGRLFLDDDQRYGLSAPYCSELVKASLSWRDF